jgi:hypothetical protein
LPPPIPIEVNPPEKTMPKFHARVHAILARDAKTAVIIRRGPSRSVCTIGWDLRSDTFKLGQWLRGRIYERRCDISPDGKHFIYFTLNGKWDSETGGSHTVISKAPYLKAIGLWANGSGWNGGGLFMSNTTFWLNSPWYQEQAEMRKPAKMEKLTEFPFKEPYGGECPGVYYHRLQRDGWKMVRDEKGAGDDHIRVFEKVLPKGWVLEKSAHATIHHPVGKGCYFDTHRLLRPESGQVIDCPGWDWADLDRKRLVWAERGVLYAAAIHGTGLGPVKALHDFNGMEFEAIPAPY